MAFLDNNNILYDFRAKHSTIHRILHLLNKVLNLIPNIPKEYSVSKFGDLSKALDVNNHNIL